MSTLFGAPLGPELVAEGLPVMMKPAIITLPPVPTCSRVEMFPSVAGLGVGVGIALEVGLGVAVGVAALPLLP